MEYYSALKKKNILTHATIRMKLKDMLTEISQAQEENIYDSIHMKHLQHGNSLRQKGDGLREREQGISVYWGQSFTLGRWKSSGAVQRCYCTSMWMYLITPELYTEKWL